MDPGKDHCKPIKVVNAFNSNYIEFESNNDMNKSLSVKENLNNIRPYLSDLINDLKTQGKWKIELTVEIGFMPSEDSEDSKYFKDSKETILHRQSNNSETMVSNEIIKQLFAKISRRIRRINGRKQSFL